MIIFRQLDRSWSMFLYQFKPPIKRKSFNPTPYLHIIARKTIKMHQRNLGEPSFAINIKQQNICHTESLRVYSGIILSLLIVLVQFGEIEHRWRTYLLAFCDWPDTELRLLLLPLVALSDLATEVCKYAIIYTTFFKFFK